MNIIKLTLVKGDPVWISVPRIDMMIEETELDHNKKYYKVTQIWLGGSDSPTQVQESADDIARMIRAQASGVNYQG